MSSLATPAGPSLEAARPVPAAVAAPVPSVPVAAPRGVGRRGPLIRRALMAADVAGLAVAYVGAALIHGVGRSGGALAPPGEIVLFAATLPLWLGLARLHGLYGSDDRRTGHSTADDVVGVVHLVTLGVWLLLAGSVLTGLAHPEIPRLVVFWLLALAVLPMARTVARGVCRRRAAYRQDAIVVGAGEVGQLIARKLLNHPEYGVRVVGFVDDRPRPRHPDLPEDLTILGRPDELEDLVRRLGVDRVVMAFTGRPAIDLVGCVRRLAQCDVQVDLVPRLFEALGPRVGVHSIEGVTLLGLSPARAGATARAVKRAIDVVGASVGLLLAAPLMAFIAVRIRLDSPGPVFFRQTRVGRGMERFTLLKFRTMTVGTDDRAHREYVARTLAAERMSLEAGTNGLHKPDQAAAVTRVGRVLRRTSLDELPQLVNILRGDMSLVGPRPCIPYEIEHFAPHQLERFLLPQGLTGLWQVEARANAGMAEALDMDVAYVRSWSLGFDLWLLARTPLALLRQRSRTA